MTMALAKRVQALEKRVAELAKAVQDKNGPGRPGKDDWQQTIGMSADDPLFDEIIRLGRDYRERQRPRPRRRKPHAGA